MFHPSNGAEDEEMTVELDLEDGSHVVCAIITILECQGKDYIVLLPLDENGENDDGEVWFYRYHEDENDANAEPELEFIFWDRKERREHGAEEIRQLFKKREKEEPERGR